MNGIYFLIVAVAPFQITVFSDWNRNHSKPTAVSILLTSSTLYTETMSYLCLFYFCNVYHMDCKVIINLIMLLHIYWIWTFWLRILWDIIWRRLTTEDNSWCFFWGGGEIVSTQVMYAPPLFAFILVGKNAYITRVFTVKTLNPTFKLHIFFIKK